MSTLVNIQLGYKSTSWFTAEANRILFEGQIVYLDDQSGKYKIGDGVTQLSALNFLGGSSNTISINATVNISAYQAVNIDGTLTDSSLVNKRDLCLGLATANINSGFSGNVQLIGNITNPAWNWSTNDLIYINGTTLSKTPPSTGFIQIIGKAINATTIEININPTIRI